MGGSCGLLRCPRSDLRRSNPLTEQNPDFLKQLVSFGDKHLPAVLARWGDLVKNGGTMTQRHICSACGNKEQIQVKMIDLKGELDMVNTLRQASAEYAKQAKDEDESKASTKILKDLSEMSNAALAKYTSDLEAELALLDV